QIHNASQRLSKAIQATELMKKAAKMLDELKADEAAEQFNEMAQEIREDFQNEYKASLTKERHRRMQTEILNLRRELSKTKRELSEVKQELEKKL
ncbi:unnamed protein product, partial [marine sediment metagenome]